MDLQDLLSGDLLAFFTDSENAGESWSVDGDTDIDELFLAASQMNTFDLSHPLHDVTDAASVSADGPVPAPRPSPTSATPRSTQPANQSAPQPFHLKLPSTTSRFAVPVSEEEICRRRTNAVPKKTSDDTRYCIKIWEEWSRFRTADYGSHIPPLSSISLCELQHWMTRFVCEIRKKDGSEYPPNTLHHICSGILRYLRANGYPTLDIFKDSEFHEFRASLDAEMRRLQKKGLGSKTKQAEPITEDEEEVLWEKGLLGDHSPQALLNTIVYMNGLYFALRSGREHRDLRFSSSQIEVVEREGERAYLLYTEDDSKNHPGGLRGRRIQRKVVKHHANDDNPSRCFVRLFKLYKSLCPSSPKRNALYLQPLKKPSSSCWYSREPLGHNKLSNVVAQMCRTAGLEGFRTNHSLRATSATRLFSAGTDEQLIMERTGHRSIDGVRSYKRASDTQHQDISNILNRSKKCKIQSEVRSVAPVSSASLLPSNNTSQSSYESAPLQSEPPACITVDQPHCNVSNSISSIPGTFMFNSCQSVVINIHNS